jgi:hypothetical protein
MNKIILPLSLLTLFLAAAQAAPSDQGMTLEPIASQAVPGSKGGMKGFRVGKVDPGSPADKAGIQEEDVLLGIDSKPIDDYKDAHKQLREGGDHVLLLLRATGNSGQQITVTLKGEKAEKKVGLLDAPAPAWAVGAWRNLPEGKTALEAADLKGKVVVLLCFEAGKAPSHKHGFPVLKKLVEHYQGKDDVAFVAVQTAVEDFPKNTEEKAWACAEKVGLKIPFGHSGEEGKKPALVEVYKVQALPWFVIIDKEGTIRLSQARVEVEEAVRLVDKLRS